MITKEDEEYLKAQLVPPCGNVKIEFGDDVIHYQFGQVSNTRLGIMTFINGKMNYELTTRYPHTKFMNEVTRSSYSAAKKKKLLEVASKRYLKSMGINIDRKYSYCTPVFYSVRTLISRLKKNDEIFEIIREEA